MLVLPVVVAIGFLKVGGNFGASRFWVVFGGTLACACGGVWLITAAWTGVKGTSSLVITTEEPWIICARVAISLIIYALAVRMATHA